MDTDRRRAAVRALGELAESADYRDRVDAGHGLARFAELPAAAEQLVALVLDQADTLVTRETAGALLRRQDRAGLAVVACALAAAGPNHHDWIDTAVLDVFGVFAADRDAALRLCAELSRDAGADLARGARLLHETLADLDPALRPVAGGGR